MNATTDQIDTIKAKLRAGQTLTTSNRGGWNGDSVSAPWIDYQMGEVLSARDAERIIDFLNRQASR